MKSVLSPVQRYALVITAIIVISVLVAVSTDDLGVIDEQFGVVVDVMGAVLMGEIPFVDVPLVVMVLACGAVYFTFRFSFINLRGIKHAVKVILGKYDKEDDPGEVSHFQALSTALSATVGLGNIAGVAIAVAMGGPGAVFWMMLAAVFGMASKFAECTLGQMYRKVDEEGVVQGGPMVYLRDGLAELGKPTLGKFLAVLFAILCIGASFGGGNMFQANQSFQAMTELVPWLEGERATGSVTVEHDEPVAIEEGAHLVRLQAPSPDDEEQLLTYHPLPTDYVDGIGVVDFQPEDWSELGDGRWSLSFDVRAADTGEALDIGAGAMATIEFGAVDHRDVEWATPEGMTISNDDAVDGGANHRGWVFGFVMVILVGLVIVGGIKRIGMVAAKIVPAMCLLYVTTALFILITHYDEVPAAALTIVTEAFSPEAGVGGLVGVIVIGIQRAVFSSEAGIGSAAIAHSAAKTKEPVREGFVALLEPAIDTIIVCFMTGAVIVITGVYADPLTAGLDDIALTQAAFGTVIWWFPYLLAIAVVLFAFSTMISWSYYGERCWSFLFGAKESMTFRIIFLFFILLGAVSTLDNVLSFADMMLLSMAFPNIIGAVMLAPKIKTALESYWERLHAGDFD